MTADDAEPEPDRMRLLAHYSLSLVSTWISTWLVRSADRRGPPLGRGGKPLERLPPFTMAFFTNKASGSKPRCP